MEQPGSSSGSEPEGRRFKSCSRNQRHKTTHAAPPGGVVVPGKHTQNPPQTQLNLQQAHPPVRRPITIPPLKAETIPAPVPPSTKDAPPKRPCMVGVGPYGMSSRDPRKTGKER